MSDATPTPATSEPVPQIETEVAIWAKVTHPEGLREALHKEDHEQLEGSFTTGVRQRTRKTTTDTEVTYELTLKIPQAAAAGVSANEEYPVTITEGFHEAYRKAAKKLNRKTRFIFQGEGASAVEGLPEGAVLPAVKYEVDVFQTVDGSISQWVKIDVELDDFLKALSALGVGTSEGIELKIKVSHLPFKPVDAFIGKLATPEQKALLDDLWDNKFNLPTDWVHPGQTVD